MCSISVWLSDKSRAVFLKSQFSESTNLLDFQIGKWIHLNPNYECTKNVKYNTVRFLVCFFRICSSEQQIKPFTKSAKVLDHPWQGKQKHWTVQSDCLRTFPRVRALTDHPPRPGPRVTFHDKRQIAETNEKGKHKQYRQGKEALERRQDCCQSCETKTVLIVLIVFYPA